MTPGASRDQAARHRPPGEGDRGPSEGSETGTVDLARRLLAIRRLREAMLGPQFFSDPAWDMLLDLYVQTRRDRPVSVSTLCLSAAVPNTTALRCLNGLVTAGLLVRRADPNDGRRAFVSFTPAAEESMRLLLARAAAELQRAGESG